MRNYLHVGSNGIPKVNGNPKYSERHESVCDSGFSIKQIILAAKQGKNHENISFARLPRCLYENERITLHEKKSP